MHSTIIKWIVLRQKNQMFLSWRPGADRVSAPSTLQTMAEIVTVSRSRLDTAFVRVTSGYLVTSRVM